MDEPKADGSCALVRVGSKGRRVQCLGHVAALLLRDGRGVNEPAESMESEPSSVSKVRRSGADLGPEFSAVLAGSFATNLGDGIRLAALPLLATTLTTSPALIGGLVAAQFLPWTTFAPFGGVIVDRSDRRRLILITQAWRSLLMAALALAVMADLISLWHLFVVAFLITVGEILVDPSVVATVPTLVSRANLDKANGRLTTVEIATNNFVGGPVGAATFGVAPWLPFLLDSVSYAVSILPFRRLPTMPVKKAQSNQKNSSARVEIGEGMRWIKGHPFLRPVTLAIAVFHLGTAGAFGLLVLLVKEVLGGSDFSFGLVLAASAVGATLASLGASSLTNRFSRRMVTCSSTLVTALSVFGVAVSETVWQLAIAWFLNGAGGAVSIAIGRGFVQRHTPNHLLGRTAIASRTITRTSLVVGALAAGAIADWSSIRAAFVASGLFHVAGVVLLWRSFRHEPD